MMLWTLPGPRRFVEGVVRSLEADRHVILVLPRAIRDEGIVGPLELALRGRRLGPLAPIVLNGSNGAEPLDEVALAMGHDAHAFLDVGELLACRDAPARYVAVTGLEGATANGGERWRRLLLQIGESAQLQEAPPYLFVWLVPPTLPVPPPNVRLAHHTWWGVLGSVDLDWTIEAWLREFPPDGAAARIWLRALCRGLCQADPALAQVFIERFPRDLDEVRSALSGRHPGAPSVSSNGETGDGVAGGIFEIAPGEPPGDGSGRDLWEAGLLDWQRGHGPSLHPAALLAADDGAEALERRWVMGQQEVLLPLVEAVRRALLRWLEVRFGPHWLREFAGEAGLEPGEIEAVETEIGPLAYRLGHPRFRREQGGLVRDVAEAWRRIRNCLAHNELVPYDELARAVRLFERFAGR